MYGRFKISPSGITNPNGENSISFDYNDGNMIEYVVFITAHSDGAVQWSGKYFDMDEGLQGE